MSDRINIALVVLAVALGLAGIVYAGNQLSAAEARGAAERASAMGRTFQLNGHTYTSIGTTFGMKVECVSADAPTQYLSVAAVLALAGTPLERP